MKNKTVSYVVKGLVQGIMFRQTFIRGALNQGLKAGSSNDPSDRSLVTITLHGNEQVVDDFMQRLQQTQPLNSWGASVQSTILLEHIIPIEQHQVTTENVDNFNWTPGVEMFL